MRDEIYKTYQVIRLKPTVYAFIMHMKYYLHCH